MTAADRSQTWRADVLTLYPLMFPGPLAVSLAGRALAGGLWSCTARNIRDHATDRHHTVDGPPAGGGPGLVMRPDIVARAIDAARPASDPRPLLCLSARGARLTQARVRELASGPGVVLLCGRFEGIDARVIEARGAEEVSVGDIVLSGGEIAALALMDAVVRLLPGVMGSAVSGDEESFESGLLEYPQYTKPRDFEGYEIPSVLLSGDHGKVAAWRRAQGEAATAARRPDLWREYLKTKGE
ncbi:tRNA (guanine(37)-N(1))-methyltransferase [hydrothermal vent metagenome]|uniref:tRNA (guanine-N(1)-)-methyltransferase n=1 Tax=hydrothermal vent metagenome TaxID=652676 RepID=A0A3B0T214_9ZZZZ